MRRLLLDRSWPPLLDIVRTVPRDATRYLQRLIEHDGDRGVQYGAAHVLACYHLENYLDQQHAMEYHLLLAGSGIAAESSAEAALCSPVVTMPLRIRALSVFLSSAEAEIRLDAAVALDSLALEGQPIGPALGPMLNDLYGKPGPGIVPDPDSKTGAAIFFHLFRALAAYRIKEGKLGLHEEFLAGIRPNADFYLLARSAYASAWAYHCLKEGEWDGLKPLLETGEAALRGAAADICGLHGTNLVPENRIRMIYLLRSSMHEDNKAAGLEMAKHARADGVDLSSLGALIPTE